MRLAEALIERADLQKRLEQLRARIVQNASYQEGEQPAEDAAVLLDEHERALARLELLVVGINAVNAATRLADGASLTELLARRETLRARHAALTQAADAAGGGWGRRQLRSELRQLSALPVPELRQRADDTARELRELDARIQQANWETEVPSGA